jgi:hypothetical protein
MANAVTFPDTGKSLKHIEIITLLRYKIRCMRSMANEIGHFAQALKCGVKGTNTIKFIRREDIPVGRKATYGSFVVVIKNHKEETECTRLTVGGDQIEYPGDKSTRTAGLSTANMLFNSTISTPGARFLVIDINNFHLNTPLEHCEYMVVMMASLPQEVIYKYGLNDLAVDVKVYIQIEKGMYGVPQAGILANELLQRRLAQDVYLPTSHTHGLCTHDAQPITFSLVVDNFGIKYVGQEHVKHLKSSIEKHYQISCDWTGSAYCVLQLDWDYKKMLIYLCRDTSRQHYTNTNIQHQQALKMHHTHGALPYMTLKRQYIEEHQNSPLLPQKDATCIQQLADTLL